MKRRILTGLVVLLIAAGLVLAAKPTAQKGFSLPANAKEVAPGVFSLGVAVDHGRLVEGYAFVHYKDRSGNAKPTGYCGDGICGKGENANNCAADCGGSSGGTTGSTCYGYLASGAKWKTVEPYVVDPDNTQGLDASFISSNVELNIEKWEAAAGQQIIGAESVGQTDGADSTSPDYVNEFQFGSIDTPGAIAVTTVWGIFRGPPSQRELVEWDMVLDQQDFQWTADGTVDTDKMDFNNIVTHELGHAVGMADLYTSDCSEQTMYGYADYGETKKQTLEEGDKTGVFGLYN